MQLTPYLIFDGQCEEALNFYAKTIGGEVRDLMRYEGSPAEAMADDAKKVLHAHFVVDGNIFFMASDSGKDVPVAAPGGMVHLSLDFKDEGRLENVFATMSDGGTVSMPLQDTFWGARFGMLTDQYGINWMFNYDKKK